MAWLSSAKVISIYQQLLARQLCDVWRMSSWAVLCSPKLWQSILRACQQAREAQDSGTQQNSCFVLSLLCNERKTIVRLSESLIDQITCWGPRDENNSDCCCCTIRAPCIQGHGGLVLVSLCYIAELGSCTCMHLHASALCGLFWPRL